MRLSVIIIFICLIFTACFEDESPVKPYDRGNVITGVAGMGPLYESQVYFSLDKDSVIKTNKITDWDLGFSCDDNAFDIILNYSKSMKALDLGVVSYDSLNKVNTPKIDDTLALWNYDNSEGISDSLAINKWYKLENGKPVSLNHVYLIDRGTDGLGKQLGVTKIQIIEFKDNAYKIKFENFKNAVSGLISITKNNKYNFVQCSFNGIGSALELEPPKNDWDLLFTRYTQVLFTTGEEIWYSVTTPLINSKFVLAGRLKGKFDSINVKVLDTIKLSPYRNAIGHEWKFYDLTSQKYSIYPTMIFIIKSNLGFYYKFHFVGFYDDNGEKGFPMFEFQKI